jgi:hypothetical protein
VEAEPVAEDVEPVVEAEPVVEDAEPVAEDVEPVVEAEPVVEDAEPVVEHAEPVAQDEPIDVEPIDLESVVPVERSEETPETVEVEEPVAEEELPSAVSPSLEGLAADVAAAQEPGQEEEAGDDGPVNVKSVETVSAMDLIMGAAEEDSAKSHQDEGPASA